MENELKELKHKENDVLTKRGKTKKK